MRMFILPAVVALALTGCGKKAEAPAETANTTAPAANENTASPAAPAATGTPTVTNWAGRYVGKTAGSDGKPLDATLLLKDDGSYALTTASASGVKQVSGKIGWGVDGKTVILDASGNGAQFQIAEGGMHVLDAAGKPYTGADATVYVLRKR